jgi:hypothetical protein
MQLSAVRRARIAYNFMYNCKAGITFAPEKERGAHEGRAAEQYVVPALSLRDTVLYNVLEGFMCDPPGHYVASTYGITVIGDSSLVQYNKIRRFNFSGLRTGEFGNIQYSYDPRETTFVPEKNHRAKVRGTRVVYNVIDSTNNDPYDTVYYGPDYAPFFINAMENGLVQYNTVTGTLPKHHAVKTKNAATATIRHNSWQGGDKLPVFENAIVQQISTPTTVLTSRATDEGPVQYRWVKLSGDGGKILSPANSSTVVTGLKTGWYLFLVEATDTMTKKAINMALVVVEKNTAK